MVYADLLTVASRERSISVVGRPPAMRPSDVVPRGGVYVQSEVPLTNAGQWLQLGRLRNRDITPIPAIPQTPSVCGPGYHFRPEMPRHALSDETKLFPGLSVRRIGSKIITCGASLVCIERFGSRLKLQGLSALRPVNGLIEFRTFLPHQ